MEVIEDIVIKVKKKKKKISKSTDESLFTHRFFGSFILEHGSSFITHLLLEIMLFIAMYKM